MSLARHAAMTAGSGYMYGTGDRRTAPATSAAVIPFASSSARNRRTDVSDVD